MKHITIKDIAKELNVSVATISRAFNDKYDIRKDTKEMILKKAREMGYTPNSIAKRLIQKRSYTIGVMIPEFTNMFFPKVIVGIQDTLIKAGYQALIMISNEDQKAEIDILNKLKENMVDGLIISMCKNTANIEHFQELVQQEMPMVFFNRVSDKIPAPQVILDDYKCAFFATEHLILQGYKKIHHLYADQEISFVDKRIKGYKDALKKYKLPFDDSYLFDGHFTVEGGKKIAQKMLECNNIPDAVFSCNDFMAIGAMKEFKNKGYKIPEEIGFFGFSDSKSAELIEPALSTIKQEYFDMGKKSADLLLKQIEEGDVKTYSDKVISMRGKLVLRPSSMRKPG
ncbi:LacI family DNA-binding transcriptional regulator [Saccharicrinis fermentans]|uniref:Catabolite control protein n=1 Tax=Saccharicrinis fermentans DSM 9555 = JCM 21142 TaxID=869213 RepID=W7YI00_9BACT|nr:LacI family DNA-binding transcriptional regulator [Saccharicrinis fermentans]GAF04096.1 catabolite control protein [Saccharicrinis fermentans DSM 9555 = JCM 21142]